MQPKNQDMNRVAIIVMALTAAFFITVIGKALWSCTSRHRNNVTQKNKRDRQIWEASRIDWDALAKMPIEERVRQVDSLHQAGQLVEREAEDI